MTHALEVVIEDLSQKVAEAKSGGRQTYESAAFYSARPGCKFRVRVRFNGDGPYTGTHLAVFIVLCPGRYDDQLTWPLRGCISVILGHDPGCLHSDHFRPDPTFSGTQRPRAGESSRGFGLPGFVRQNVLRDPRYVKDDRFVLRAAVSG